MICIVGPIVGIMALTGKVTKLFSSEKGTTPQYQAMKTSLLEQGALCTLICLLSVLCGHGGEESG